MPIVLLEHTDSGGDRALLTGATDGETLYIDSFSEDDDGDQTAISVVVHLRHCDPQQYDALIEWLLANRYRVRREGAS